MTKKAIYGIRCWSYSRSGYDRCTSDHSYMDEIGLIHIYRRFRAHSQEVRNIPNLIYITLKDMTFILTDAKGCLYPPDAVKRSGQSITRQRTVISTPQPCMPFY